MARVRVAGSVIPNSYKWFYDWMGEESTCPSDIEQAIAEANGELLTVEIDSPGGVITAGSRIYTDLREYGNVEIEITGHACSAASVIAMAGHCMMSPTAMMMIHCVSTSCSGNHTYMRETAEMLEEADRAMSTAYVDKTGKSQEEILELMEAETWISASKALELGLVDGILFHDQAPMAASLFQLPTEQEMEEARRQMRLEERKKTQKKKLELLKMKGAKAR